MASNNFTITLDIDNISKGIADWDKVSRAVLRGIELGKEEVADRMKDKMLEYLSEYGLSDSEIAKSILVVPIGEGFYLTAGSEYAIYVEYGTGLMGENNPHPKPDGWQYNIGETIRENGGWWYPTTADDPNPHKKVFNGNLYAWTIAGQPSRPFMYRTWLWGSRSATQIIRKNINRELKKTGVK
jgi:hypothetical protein